MRYALDWCLFGFPQGDKEIASAQCSTACGRISNALKTNLPNATASSTYDYCRDPNFLPNVGSCAACYKNVPNQLYLSNCKHSSLTSEDCCPDKMNPVLKTIEYACQNQPSPVLPFAVKPSDIFTNQPPSNFSDLGTNSSSSHGLSHDARVAIAISVPVAAFLLFSLLLVYFYVHKNAPPDLPHHSTRQHNYNEKHVSKSTSGWSKSPSRKGTHSRNRSSNSASQQVPYPAPLKPSKVAVPAPLRTRNSPIPFSRNYYQPTNYGLEKPSKPTPPPATYSPEMLPATRYSPPHTKSPSLEPQKAPRPGQSKPGLVSWERIAIQNAQIRAELGPSPSPISPLTKVQVVPKPRSPLSQRSSGSTKRERFPVVPSSSQSPAPREERRRSALKSPAPSEQQQRHSVLTSPLSREETHPALRSPTLSEEIRTTLASPVSTEYDRDDVTPSLDNRDSSLFRKESQDSTITPTTPTLFNKRLNPFSPPLLLRQGSISRQSTPFRQERQEAQEMVDRQERQQQQQQLLTMSEIPEGEGLEGRDHNENENENENEGSEDFKNNNNPYERRRDASAGGSTPRASLSRKSRGSLEGVMSGGSRKSVERGGARKEVRWSKDVDYEG